MDMLKERQNTSILDRISRVAAWVGVPRDFKDDLVQEAWILCSYYAQKQGRLIEELSTTEIRLRCFEARRKILAPKQEMLVDNVVELESYDVARESERQHDVLEDMMRQENARGSTHDIEALAWVLETHPTLKLTPSQYDLWEIYRGDPYGRWKAKKARERGVTRQNVANIVRVVRKKLECAVDLIRLWDGNVLPFFEKYSAQWNSRIHPLQVKRILWSILSPRVGESIPRKTRRYFRDILPAIGTEAVRLLTEEQRALKEDRANVHNLLTGYYMLVTASHIVRNGIGSTQTPLFQNVENPPWLTRQFERRATMLTSTHGRDTYHAMLKQHLGGNSADGKRDAGYTLAYYGGASEDEAQRFLASNGEAFITQYRVDAVISEVYKNLGEKMYQESHEWGDVNFMRLCLVHAYYPFEARLLPECSRNALATICQKSLHSHDSFVVLRAERWLYEIQMLRP